MVERCTVDYNINHLHSIGLIFKMSQMSIKTRNKVKRVPKFKEKERESGKLIKSKMINERYQINFVELSNLAQYELKF